MNFNLQLEERIGSSDRLNARREFRHGQPSDIAFKNKHNK